MADLAHLKPAAKACEDLSEILVKTQQAPAVRWVYPTDCSIRHVTAKTQPDLRRQHFPSTLEKPSGSGAFLTRLSRQTLSRWQWFSKPATSQHSGYLIFHPAASSSVTCLLENACFAACLWFGLLAEESPAFIPLVKSPQQGFRSSFGGSELSWGEEQPMSDDFGGEYEQLLEQGSHEMACWAFAAAPGCSESEFFQKSRQVFSRVTENIIPARIHPSRRNGSDCHANGWAGLKLLSYD